MGRWIEAEESLHRALALAPELPEAHHNLGTLRHDEDRLEEAVTCYRRALTLRPAFASALYNLANVLRELGRVEEAEPYARHAKELAPDDAKATVVLADVLQDLDHFSEALSYYDQIFSPRPKGEGSVVRDAEAQRNRAFCLLASGNLTEGWMAYAARQALLKPLSLTHGEWTGIENLDGKTIIGTAGARVRG